jgi:pimeloyl-ACP methyl ester carboxylesterase
VHTLQVDGGRIEIAWWGSHSATRLPIVLLHEGLGSVSLWRDFPDELSRRTGRLVMAYSRFGHGASDVPSIPRTTSFMHDEARLLPSILDASDLRRAILLGHSDGGSIALIAAAEYPSRVEALMLEAPHVFVEDVSVASIQERAAAFRDVENSLREKLGRHHEDVEAAFTGWSNVWLDPRFRDWNIEAYLPRITCPVLLIQGEDDRYGTLRQLDAIQQQVRGPAERLVLPECGHSPHRDQREQVLNAMTGFALRRG